jgi:hypothetical protein
MEHFCDPIIRWCLISNGLFNFDPAGEAVSLAGFVSDLSGQYSVTLDNQTTTLSGHSSFFYSDALLFFATEIGGDHQHRLVVQNMEDRVLALKVGGISYATGQNKTQ